MRRLHVAAAVWLGAAAPGCDLVFSINPGGDAGAGGDAAPDASPMPRWSEVATGGNHTCAVQASDLSLWCWGDNRRGQLGDNTFITRNQPTPVALARRWRGVTAGYEFTCAIDADDGRAWCWGDNGLGMLGNGSTVTAAVPGLVSSGVAWQRLVAGKHSVCGIDATEALWCWGNGDRYRLGTTTVDVQLVPVSIGALTGWTDLSLLAHHGCGIVAGQVHCWGGNYRRQAAPTMAADNILGPTAVALPAAALEVVTGEIHSCARLENDETWCWGADSEGQFGNGVGDAGPGPVLNSEAWRDLSAGEFSTCGLTPSGVLSCWGRSRQGLFGLAPQELLTLPTEVSDATWQTFALGGAHSCGLRDDGLLACAGADGLGQLGTGQGGPSATPARALIDVTAVDAKGAQTCVTTNDGVMSCWGNNAYGQLGLGDQEPRQTPSPITPLSNVTTFAVGGRTGCAVSESGMHCWGNDDVGALGNGAAGSTPTPMNVSGLSYARMLSASDHVCAIDANTITHCWGANSFKQVSANVGVPSIVEQPLTLGVSAAKVVVGRQHSCLLNSTGGMSCWGRNHHGQLGNGVVAADTDFGSVPVAVEIGGQLITDLGAGSDHTCAVTADRRLYCWGVNWYGQLGQPLTETPTPREIPVPDINLLWDRVGLGEHHTCAVTADEPRRLFCMGWNRAGQTGAPLGALQYTDTMTEVLHPEGRSWSYPVGGSEHTCAVDDARALWCWGANESGQRGTNNAWRSAFTIVP